MNGKEIIMELRLQLFLLKDMVQTLRLMVDGTKKLKCKQDIC